MRKVVISSFVIVVLLLGVGLYLCQARDLNASSTLSVDEMGKISGGRGSDCTGGKNCPTSTVCRNFTSPGSVSLSGNGSIYGFCVKVDYASNCQANISHGCGWQRTYDNYGCAAGGGQMVDEGSYFVSSCS